jgi:hypothetical protein
VSKTKYSLTPSHRKQLKPWADKWIANAMSTKPMTEEDREITRQALRGMYLAAGRPEPKAIVFVPSPFVLVFAAGAAACRLSGTEKSTRYATNSATRDATEEATRYETTFATRDATARATWAVTAAAMNYATADATRDATSAAIGSATVAATTDAAEDATRFSTVDAVDRATRAAVRVETDFATRAVADRATWAVTDSVRSATEEATVFDTMSATNFATDAETRDATWAVTGSATVEATRAATARATRAATARATRAATYAQNLQNWYVFPDDISWMTREELESASSARSCWQGGNQWSAYDSFLSFFDRVVGLDLPEYKAWRHWEQASLHSGPRIVQRDFAMVSDRPEILLVDDQNRPHCDTGPFCRWRDGSALYAVHGVRVPAWTIEHPELITVAHIDGERNSEVRRVMVERFGSGRYMLEGGGVLVAKDSWGELWRRDVDGDEPLMLTRVWNSTPEADGTRHEFWETVHPELRPLLDDDEYGNPQFGEPQELTVRNAIASQFGLRGEEYAPEVET